MYPIPPDLDHDRLHEKEGSAAMAAIRELTERIANLEARMEAREIASLQQLKLLYRISRLTGTLSGVREADIAAIEAETETLLGEYPG